MTESQKSQLSSGKKIVFGCIWIALVLILAEAGVRVTGLADDCSAELTRALVCDPILGYRINPKFKPLGQPLNRAGFRTHEFGPKQPGVYRIVSLGDSNTLGRIGNRIGWVREPYPQRLERIVEERVGPGKVEVFNAGMSAYMSFHGVMLLRTKLRGLEPDLITVRYGWADHLMSSMIVESGSVFREPQSALGRAVEDVLLQISLYRFARRLGLELQALRRPVADQARAVLAEQTGWKAFIALPDYQHNLRRIVEIGHGRGAEVWLLTSPWNPAPGRTAAKMLGLMNKLSYDQVIEIHRSYNEATRQVGAELDVPVVDLEALYGEHADEVLFIPEDTIHPIQAGHDLEAGALYGRLVKAGILPTSPN